MNLYTIDKNLNTNPLRRVIKFFLWIALLILTGLIGTCLYFVAGVSSTLPPIKTYDYPESVDQLKAELDNLHTLNKNISYAVTDRTGGPEYNTSYCYYITVNIKTSATNFEYHIKYDQTDYRFATNKTIISLIFAYNNGKGLGGYSLKADGILPIIDVFEKNVMLPLLKRKTTLRHLKFLTLSIADQLFTATPKIKVKRTFV